MIRRYGASAFALLGLLAMSAAGAMAQDVPDPAEGGELRGRVRPYVGDGSVEGLG